MSRRSGVRSSRPPDVVKLLNGVTDRLDWLWNHSRCGSDIEQAMLTKMLDVGIEAVEHGELAALRGPHDPPRFCWPDGEEEPAA